MPERIDRRIGNNSLLWVVVLIMVIIAASAGTYAWVRSKQTSFPVEAQPGVADQSVYFNDPVSITLFVPDDDGLLLPEQISLEPEIDAQTQAKKALIAELAYPQVLRTPVLGRMNLRAFFIDQEGTGYVDLVPAAEGVKASAREELLAIYAIVNMLCRNFEDIRQVRFLLDGREAQTLAGHIDLSGKFIKRTDLEKF